MEYFEFYGLTPKLGVDTADLKRRFYQKSRELHPDFHSMEDEETQAKTMDLAAFNNKAYHTLRDPSKRIQYVLQQKNLLAEEGENKLPQAFLMEMMDLNEALMDVKMDPTPEGTASVKDQIAQLRDELDGSIASLFDLEQLEDLSADDWSALHDHHLKTKYLERLEENLSK